MIGVSRARGVIVLARCGVMDMHGKNFAAAKPCGNPSDGNNNKHPRVGLIKHQRAADFGELNRAANLRNRARTGA